MISTAFLFKLKIYEIFNFTLDFPIELFNLIKISSVTILKTLRIAQNCRLYCVFFIYLQITEKL